MKLNLTKSKIFALAIVTLFSTSFAAPAFANSNPLSKKPEISYIGTVDNLPVYRLSLKNETFKVFNITAKDGKGTVIYNKQVSGSNITREYQLEAKTIGDYKVTFTVTDLKGNTVGVLMIGENS